MNSKILFKLVKNGFQKNKRTVLPYIIAGIVTVMMFYIMNSLASCPYIYDMVNKKEAFYGARYISVILGLGGQIIGIFSCFFLFYANQFMMRGRKKELGLFGILGLSQKDIAGILWRENLCFKAGAIFGGIIAGTFLNKIMLLVLLRILGREPISGLFLSGKVVMLTIIYFWVVYTVIFMYNMLFMNANKPIALLKSENMGEKEPKVKWALLILGVITLALGYAMALGCSSPSQAIGILFISVILVIAGTYCLFITGSIFILKCLKKSKKFFYKAQNFVSVSGLLYRMKHNATGLASICVLSTGVILLMTCASSLMMLGEKNMNTMFPRDYLIYASEETGNEKKDMMKALQNAAKESHTTVTTQYYLPYARDMWVNAGDELKRKPKEDYLDLARDVDVYIVSLKDYRENVDANATLGQDEILLVTDLPNLKHKLVLDGMVYNIKAVADKEAYNHVKDPSMGLFSYVMVVCEDVSQMTDSSKQVFFGTDVEKGQSSEKLALFKNLLQEELAKKQIASAISVKEEDRAFFYNIYGGAFFVGLFLSALFLMATVMIIYYKQMSEGYEDRKRFEILTKVGMTDAEVKKTIKKQVMLLFFLPVGTAILHMLVASKIVRLFLKMILIVDPLTFFLSILLVAAIFLVVYALVYKITSVQYYKIVMANTGSE